MAARAPISVADATATLNRVGLPKPYVVTLPQGPREAFAGTYSPAHVKDLRIVYIDQFNARVLDDVGTSLLCAAVVDRAVVLWRRRTAAA